MSANLELKVRCTREDIDRIERLARETWAISFQQMRQRDTYFGAMSGRLKLREITPHSGPVRAELIGYHRANEPDARWSRYSRIELPPDGADGIRLALSDTLGVLIVVDKCRRLGVWRRTRIHLDLVAGLGAFVELETVTGDENDPTASAELEEVAGQLGLRAFPVIGGSYSDLLLTAGS